ncbi:MAG: DeoR/GlpR family DNA-binding transcription regulator, partial [Eubacterium sp.]
MRELMVDRRKSIMEDLYQNGSVKASTLASIHNVGIETIRRDLKKLADEYGFELTYGGAYIREISPFENYREKPLSVKRSENQDAKSIIAKKAAQLVDTGDIIALNSGSTTESMLPHLENKTPLNLLTLDINIAYSASKITGLDVFFPGGKIRFQSGIAVGLSVREYINLFHIDKLFFG